MKLCTHALVAPYVALERIGLVGGERRDVDDRAAAPLQHAVERSVREPHEREHVEADRALLVGDVELGERAERAHARVVDEEVDRARTTSRRRASTAARPASSSRSADERRRVRHRARHGARPRSSRAERRRARRARRRRRGPRARRRRRARYRRSRPVTSAVVMPTGSARRRRRRRRRRPRRRSAPRVITRSGSFSPCPVTVHTTMSSGDDEAVGRRLGTARRSTPPTPARRSSPLRTRGTGSCRGSARR